jgi:hypothetical protein
LVSEYGFRSVRTEATFVRFESEAVFVNVYHGRASYELGVEIGQPQKVTGLPAERRFTLYEFVVLNNAEKVSGYTYYQVSRPELMGEFVNRLADLTKRYCGLALMGGPEIFEKVAQVRSRLSAQLMKEMALEGVRPQVDEAWRAKNFKRVIDLYESIEPHLTEAERKKLTYARRHLK